MIDDERVYGPEAVSAAAVVLASEVAALRARVAELEARLALAQRVIDLTDAYWARAETGSGAALRAARAEWDRGEK